MADRYPSHSKSFEGTSQVAQVGGRKRKLEPTYFTFTRLLTRSIFFPTLSILGLFNKTCFWADLAFGHVAAREQPPGVCVGDARKNGRTVASAARASHRALRPLHRVDHQNSSADQHRRPGVRGGEPMWRLVRGGRRDLAARGRAVRVGRMRGLHGL